MNNFENSQGYTLFPKNLKEDICNILTYAIIERIVYIDQEQE